MLNNGTGQTRNTRELDRSGFRSLNKKITFGMWKKLNSSVLSHFASQNSQRTPSGRVPVFRTDYYGSATCLWKKKARCQTKLCDQCVISGFLLEAAENCAFLRYYAKSSGNFLLAFRDNLPFRSWIFYPWNMGSIGCPETLARNCHHSLRNKSEERSYHLYVHFTNEVKGISQGKIADSRRLRLIFLDYIRSTDIATKSSITQLTINLTY